MSDRFETLRVEADGAVGMLTLARPERLNALSRRTLIELADAASVYKLYAIVDETTLTAGAGTRICGDFLRHLLPEFNAALERSDTERMSDETAGRTDSSRS